MHYKCRFVTKATMANLPSQRPDMVDGKLMKLTEVSNVISNVYRFVERAKRLSHYTPGLTNLRKDSASGYMHVPITGKCLTEVYRNRQELWADKGVEV